MAELSELPETVWNVVDTQGGKLRESLLIFTCGLMNFAVMLWLAIYWMMGTYFSANIPLAYQLVSIASLIVFLKTRNFAVFRFVQLNLFLFAPFIMQWSLGSSVSSSGVMLWALLAPVAAVVVSGWRESIPWFIAYIVLTAVSGFFDYFLGVGEQSGIQMKTVGVLFALNFAAMTSIVYFLVRYFVLETEKIGNQLDQQHKLLVEEVADRKRTETELLRFKNVLDNTLDMIFMFEPASLRFVYLNQGAILSTGYSREELLGMTPYQLTPLMPEPEFRQLIAPLLSGKQSSLHYETVHRRKDGTDFQVAVFLQLVTQRDGSGLFVTIMHDITEKKESEEMIWQQANFDTLTGLPNRRMLYDRLEQEIKKSHRSGLPMVLMLLDLDHFKEVNDTLGHAQGDILLVEAARRIAKCVRESDTVARLGGDEFTVILSEMADVNSVERIVQNIIERLVAPFQLLQEIAYVSASVGITLYPDDAQNIDSLIKNADQAMYLAKNSGRNRFRYFTAALQEAAQTHLRLRNDLRGALVGQEFRVFYQPIVTLASGAIHKAEALLRWQHPTRGLISPAEFIPVAEEAGMIIDIGDWVFREVASQAAHWRASHYPKFQISVNISPVQFRHHGTNFKAWLDYLQKLGLPGQNIVMEITEGLLLDANTSVTDQLLVFRDAGIRVSLDDFGTGYSSLSYLKKFDIDYLKIDQSFVRNMADDANDRTLCEAIIMMAHKLGLKVIAEGVETEQQRDLLAAYGCDYAQGWLYSKAVPPEQFEALVWGQVK